jgi:histidyl-tRNA synthetase
MFGSVSTRAEFEILQIAIDLLLIFNPPKNAFTVFINDRHLIDRVLNDIIKVPENSRLDVVRLMDKWEKLSERERIALMESYSLSKNVMDGITKFMESKTKGDLIEAFSELTASDLQMIDDILKYFESIGYGEYLQFNPSVIRGFDYYDGLVFEAFDNAPDNKRALFGGGRYNGLAGLFGGEQFPAIGFAPGDESMKIFLQQWGLLNDMPDTKVTFIPVLDSDLYTSVGKLAIRLRSQGRHVIVDTEVRKSISKALKYANKINADYVVILGTDEIANSCYYVKDLRTGEQEKFDLEL